MAIQGATVRNLSRLSDLNIDDPILRANFYRLVLDYLSSKGAETIDYVVKLDEEYRPDLAAYRAFGSSELSWLIMLVGEVDDPFYGLPVGYVLTLPNKAWIRRTMRQFMDSVGL